MRFGFRLRETRRQRHRPRARRADVVRSIVDAVDRAQRELLLPSAQKFQIDLRGQFGIQQRAMLGARRQIDGKALAQFVKRITRARNLALGDLDRVDGAGIAGSARGRRDAVPH